MRKERINLIPMAGAGQRFKAAGYILPKPLIPVDGLPMVVRACDSLPEADRWVFVARTDLIKTSELARTLLGKYSQAEIIDIDYLTEGQASTCALASDLLPDDSELLIGPCDNGMLWDKDEYGQLIEDSSIDAIIWTFRHYPPVKEKARMYGWVEANGNQACTVSCKQGISDTPMNDHAIVGTFYFRRADLFKLAYQSMKKANRRVNGEFYVDELMNELIESGKNVRVFEIEKYLCWGTPDDLRTYEYWRNFFLEHY